MKKIPIPIYRGYLLIHIGRPSDKLIKKYHIEVEPDHLAAVHDLDEGVLVWFTETTFEASIVAHEAIHIKNIVFDQIAAKPDFDNDEYEAYFVEWVVETIEKVYKKHTSSKQ